MGGVDRLLTDAAPYSNSKAFAGLCHAARLRSVADASAQEQMNQLLARQLDETLTEACSPNGLRYEAALRVAAATLSHAAADEIPATTMIGVLGADDLAAFKTLVADITDEFGIDARIRLNVGSFSVRFTHQSVSVAETQSDAGQNSILAHILHLWRQGT